MRLLQTIKHFFVEHTFSFEAFGMYLLQVWFKLLTFNRNEFVTLAVALSSKRKKSIYWYANNFFIPLIVIFIPYVLTLLSEHFKKINFHKSVLELGMTGALTLLGVNVMRTSLSLVNEKIDESKIPENIKKNVTEDIESIKSKLRLWIQFLTLIGGIAYLVQAGSFVDPTISPAEWYFVGFALVCLLSIYISRLIVVIQSNFTDNESLIQVWIQSLSYNSEKDYSSLKSLAQKEGL